MTAADRIRSARERLRLSQRELAERLGTGREGERQRGRLQRRPGDAPQARGGHRLPEECFTDERTEVA